MNKNDKLFIDLCLMQKDFVLICLSYEDKLVDMFKSKMLDTEMGRIFVDFSSPNVLQEIKESERVLFKRKKA